MLYISVKRKINEQPLPKGNNKNTQNVEHLGNPTKKKTMKGHLNPHPPKLKIFLSVWVLPLGTQILGAQSSL